MNDELAEDKLRGRRAVAELARRVAMRRFLAGEIDLAEYERKVAAGEAYASGRDAQSELEQPCRD